MRQLSALPRRPRDSRAPNGPGRPARALALAFGITATLLAGCDTPPEARFDISEAAAARPNPELGETDRFKRVAEASATTADTLGSDRAGLEARAAALRATAAGLSGPVLDPASRARLTSARDAAAQGAGEDPTTE
jgi:predicted small secreted protein